MVVRVKIDGLNVIKARGKWYVYHRDTKHPLLKGFEGSKAALYKRLSQPDIIAAYNARRVRDLTRTYPADTLGGLVQWFENESRRFAKLKPATQKDYRAAK